MPRDAGHAVPAELLLPSLTTPHSPSSSGRRTSLRVTLDSPRSASRDDWSPATTPVTLSRLALKHLEGGDAAQALRRSGSSPAAQEPGDLPGASRRRASQHLPNAPSLAGSAATAATGASHARYTDLPPEKQAYALQQMPAEFWQVVDPHTHHSIAQHIFDTTYDPSSYLEGEATSKQGKWATQIGPFTVSV